MIGGLTKAVKCYYGDKGKRCGVLLDPPYRGYERLYEHAEPVALQVARWAAEHGKQARIALCGHDGDYDEVLPAGWRIVRWSRKRTTYGGAGTKDAEALYLSPACAPVDGEEPLRSVSEDCP